jgi:hypothetical protein
LQKDLLPFIERREVLTRFWEWKDTFMGRIKPNGGPHVAIQTALTNSSFNSTDYIALSKGKMVFVIKHHDTNATKDEEGKSQTALKC